MTATRLSDRAVIRLSPEAPDEDVVGFLQGLVTQDVAQPLPVWAGLLTPQGKVLFDFLVWDGGGGVLLLDCEAGVAEALAKRLGLYRLRRRIAIAVDPALAVHWSTEPRGGAMPDPRLAALGWRWLAPQDDSAPADGAWRAHRLAHGVAEGREELGNGETLWLECNADALNGVSFTKGCYVGQENTARMNWRQKVHRRLRVVPGPDGAPRVERARVDDVPADGWPDWLQATISAGS
ncbi:MAG: folate-binding protein YgfZ [Sphingomonadales bacterium]|nr:folate-binding protein YgfZ [Sphingomonadales bacterium]